MTCWNCEHTSKHSDGAVFCGPYAARREEHDKPLQNCNKWQPRIQKMKILTNKGRQPEKEDFPAGEPR